MNNNKTEFANEFLKEELKLIVSWKIRILGQDYGSTVMGKVDKPENVDEFCSVLATQIKKTIKQLTPTK